MSVKKFYPKNAANNPDNVIEQAIGVYTEVIILGYDKEGNLDIRASTNIDKANILWIIDKFRHKLLNGDYNV